MSVTCLQTDGNSVATDATSGVRRSETNPKALLVGTCPEHLEDVWAVEQRARLQRLVDLFEHPWNGDLKSCQRNMREAEVMFSTWGMPRLEAEHLDNFPNLQAVFYAAGTVKEFAGPLLERGVRVFSAYGANAIPVAEYTLSQILFALKQGWLHYRNLRSKQGPEGWEVFPVTGAYGARVGVVSLGMIGSKLCELLEPFALDVLAYDPCISPESMRKRNITPVSLEELFAVSDVVTIHTPWLKETEGMITGELIRSMKKGATFINTSRGALVREEEMIDVLSGRLDLTAILDVSFPEPPVRGSLLYTLPNVVLTPHLAGSRGREVRRLADWMLDECDAWLSGRPVRCEVTKEDLVRMA